MLPTSYIRTVAERQKLMSYCYMSQVGMVMVVMVVMVMIPTGLGE